MRRNLNLLSFKQGYRLLLQIRQAGLFRAQCPDICVSGKGDNFRWPGSFGKKWLEMGGKLWTRMGVLPFFCLSQD